MIVAFMCPECKQGKHQNCDGETLDFETDEVVTCPCHARGHRVTG